MCDKLFISNIHVVYSIYGPIHQNLILLSLHTVKVTRKLSMRSYPVRLETYILTCPNFKYANSNWSGAQARYRSVIIASISFAHSMQCAMLQIINKVLFLTVYVILTQPGSEVIKHFSCSTQLNTKFQLLIKTKLPTNVKIPFIIYQQDKFLAQLS